MSLAPGTRLGPYEIVSPLGAGGMGEVYRARDTRLDRDVAIKVLPAAFAQDADRLARFEREAKAVAALSHPNILAIHDIGTVPSTRSGQAATYVVTELLEGETVRERLQAGALPPRKAIDLAVQVARGLAAAHDKGLVHRDLKPDNLFLLKDGQVKILDFGLAKTATSDSGASETVAAITDAGVVMGTVGYMAPEQVRGQAVDARADLFTLGAVLYEMLSGRRAFQHATAAETMTAILREDPPELNGPSAALSPALDRVVRHCLEKNPAERFQTARDVAFALESLTGSGAAMLNRSTQERTLGVRSRLGAALPWLVAAVIGVVALIVFLWGWHRGDVPPGVPAQLSVELPPGVTLPLGTEHPVLALSPDGTHLVWVGDDRGRQQLYLRDLTASSATPIPGTDGATDPFFTPDGASIAFFSALMIKRVPVAGGASVAIHAATQATVNRGATWLANDSLLLALSGNDGLARGVIDADRPRSMMDWDYVTASADTPYAWPSAVPGGRFVLFTDVAGETPDQSNVKVLSLSDKGIRMLLAGGTFARDSGRGHLLFVRGGALYARPFNAQRAVITGDELKVADDVVVEPNGAAQYAVAANGTLAYVSGAPVTRQYELVWVDRTGRAASLRNDGRLYQFPRLSPDASELAVTIPTGANFDVWTLNLRTGAPKRITTSSGEDFGAVWNPDGTRLAISSEQGAGGEMGPGLAWTAGPDFRLEFPLRSPGPGNWEFPTSWSPDGKWVAFTQSRNGVPARIAMLPTDGPPTPVPFAEEGTCYGATFSPNARPASVAYVSDVTGREEVYVRPFPVAGASVPISTNGGTEPVWSRDGKTLFYREGPTLMSVTFASMKTLDHERPIALFTGRYEPTPYGGLQANYDVSPDGTHFLMVRRNNLAQPATIHIVLNWPALLTRASGRARN